MMWSKLFVILLSCLMQSNTVQSELDLTFYDTEAPFINNDYFSSFETYPNDGNAGFYINFTTVKEFPNSVRLHYKLWGASMGEFVVPTGMNIDLPFCQVFEPHYRLIGDQVELIGINGNDCPPSPGTYGADNLSLDPNNLPDEFPPNNYMAQLKVYTPFEKILEFKAFVRLAI